MKSGTPWAVHWFRRDLRVRGNPALTQAAREYGGRVLGLFCFDSAFLKRPDFSNNRFAFFLNTLEKLREELRAAGGDLLVVDAQAVDAFTKIHSENPIACVSFNRDYEPFARARDEKVTAHLGKMGIKVLSARDHLLIEPDEVGKTGPGDVYYKVFTPFSKKWFEVFQSAEVQARLRTDSTPKLNMHWKEIGTSGFKDALAAFQKENSTSVTIEIPHAGVDAARKRLKKFAKEVDGYSDRRDIPSDDGTSRLSIYFKNGSLTVAEAIAELDLQKCGLLQNSGRAKFLKELIWREFYYHILYHRPDVETQAFQSKYRDIKWKNNKKLFQTWKDGRTGYPIVDAGMRQLKTTGWMHNRVRMIVASFLTKDLLIDWRWGENHFMKELLDGDLASNNGGWQWAASTGCDAQPYFRIFNPELQSRRFDPDGDYIRRYVPELRNVSAQDIHAPQELGTAFLSKVGYVPPVVNHKQQKVQAIALFK